MLGEDEMQLIAFQIAAWSLVVTGVGHIVVDLVMRARLEEEPPAVAAMRAFEIEMPGARRTLFEFHIGFSTAMGILLAAFGGLNVVLATFAGEVVVSRPVVAGFDAGVCAVMVALALRYFFATPVILCSVATIGFGVAALL